MYKGHSEIFSFWYVEEILDITCKVGNNIGFHMTARLQILNSIFNGMYTKLVRSRKQKPPQFKVRFGKVVFFLFLEVWMGILKYADFFNFK